MAASLIFELNFATQGAQRPAEPGQPMRILVLGDFSGGAAARPALGQRPARRLDIDNFNALMAQLAPSMSLALEGATHTFQFRELDDFHPDQLYLKSDAFADLRGQRQRLKNPATFAAAAAQLRPADGVPPAPSSPPAAQASSGAAGGDNPFASLLGGVVGTAAAPAAAPIDQLVRKLVGAMPAGPDPRQADYVAAVDAVIAERMNAVLHAPAFQALEAAWRGLHMLVTGLELEESLQLHILDATKAELRADALALRRVLVEQPRSSADAAPWSLICGDYSFDGGEDDVRLLSVLGAVAAEARAPFIGAASASLLGATSLAEQPDAADWAPADAESSARWQALRASRQAAWLGLALPRVLLRLPYGKATDRVDQFDYEEAGPAHRHEDYLWGHASLACALLLGRAFQDSAWGMSASDVVDLGDLPAHTVRRDGEAHMQACAEAYLSERAGDAILRRGLMPLLSFRNRNAVRLLRSQSIATPPQALAGAWEY
ncbi:type VI secretion system contractile sheath domain-containing protein [Pseudoduganella namucuonensis]|uniref:Type VI secretion protein, EvpB/VC_A0108 family/type VI secretion protein, VC_A0107 family n=1 Tax=Pseudoduganella namucuonensis TaxID=1035707 RepID=A0A1I7L5D0_9BURK|nr:type VI secretion system contractile sheath large subunit [Pseudoduganella namucuonensis]SFV04714.1 type VI secretion protein, EvpB/VC_A0108 family/type VI secretion protein, VC_A0107 family [Pseudoduganella namucuonensis]